MAKKCCFNRYILNSFIDVPPNIDPPPSGPVWYMYQIAVDVNDYLVDTYEGALINGVEYNSSGSVSLDTPDVGFYSDMTAAGYQDTIDSSFYGFKVSDVNTAGPMCLFYALTPAPTTATLRLVINGVPTDVSLNGGLWVPTDYSALNTTLVDIAQEYQYYDLQTPDGKIIFSFEPVNYLYSKYKWYVVMNNSDKKLDANYFNSMSDICKNLNKNTLITVNRLQHIDILYNKLIQLKNKQIYIIRGDIDVPERERIRKLMESCDNLIVIALSRIFSTGISINNLHYVILANSGKAKVTTIQTLGRTIRLHKNKEKAIVFDIADSLIYGRVHLAKRVKLYDNEKIRYSITKIKEKS